MKCDTVKHPVNLSAKIRITSKMTASEQNKLVLSPVSRAKLTVLRGPDYHKEAQGIDSECFQTEEHPDILIIDKVPGNKKRIEDKRYEKGQGVQDEEKSKPQE